MISDKESYNIAILLGSASMVLIVIYHYIEVNATDKLPPTEKSQGPKASASS
jgi:oligosaccharyl transferase complex subunit OST4